MADKSITPITGDIAEMQTSVQKLFKEKTPKDVIKMRRGAGSMMFPYVPIDYVLKKLDDHFGMFWEFKIIKTEQTPTHIVVQGELTIKSPTGFSVSRPGFGRASIKCYQGTKNPVDIGNDYKAAQSDALKKAASLFGIGADVYYKELEKYEDIDETTLDEDSDLRQKTYAQLFAVANEKGLDAEATKKKIKEKYGVSHMEELTLEQIQATITNIKNAKVVKPVPIPKAPVQEEIIEVPVSEDEPEAPKEIKCYQCEKVVPPGNDPKYFCNKECQGLYWAKKPKPGDKKDFTFTK